MSSTSCKKIWNCTLWIKENKEENSWCPYHNILSYQMDKIKKHIPFFTLKPSTFSPTVEFRFWHWRNPLCIFYSSFLSSSMEWYFKLDGNITKYYGREFCYARLKRPKPYIFSITKYLSCWSSDTPHHNNIMIINIVM